MFVAKLFVGGLSGVLLAEFCPEAPPRRCGVMWLIIGVIAFSSPVMMLLTRNFIEPDRNKPLKVEESDDEGEEGSAASGSASGAGTVQMRRLKGESLSHRLMNNDVLDQADDDDDQGAGQGDGSGSGAGAGAGAAVLVSGSSHGAGVATRQRLASTDSDTRV